MGKITIGADPEVFVLNPTTGEEVSAIGLIGGTKYEPLPTLNGSVQEDNVAAEFNVHPAKTALEFVHNIQAVLADLRQIVEKHNLVLSTRSCAKFTKEELSHPEAVKAGCDPDFNAWLPYLTPNRAPDVMRLPIRSCGGHIHLGFKPKDLEEVKQVVKCMDLFLGIPSVIMDQGEERKKLYGKAGCFRLTTYGLEYRTLSNFWIFSPKHIRWAFQQSDRAQKQAKKMIFDEKLADRIINTINKNNRSEAHNIVREFGLEVVE